MLYDLNVPWSPSQSPTELERTIAFLSSLGYNTLALNHSVSSLPAQLSNPIPTTQPFALPSNTVLLRRCTLTISDPSQNHRLSQLSTYYDIIALRPTTEKAFLASCLTLADHSLISLDLTQRFPFHFKPKPLMAAVNRGIRFEICYAQATLEDAAARRNFISNCMGIMRATKGRGLVVSSGAVGVLGVRAPADVVNLLAVWGLGRDRGVESLGVNARGVVVNESLKRSSFRGVIDVIDGGEKAVVPEKGKDTPVNSAGNKAKGKRKADETNGEGTPQMSKRQAKKMRLEALKAGKEGLAAVQGSTPTPDACTPESLEHTSTIKIQAKG
jgi:ribonuclease P/MRP protein subunit RPP1